MKPAGHRQHGNHLGRWLLAATVPASLALAWGGCRWLKAQEDDTAAGTTAAAPTMSKEELEKKLAALTPEIDKYLTEGDRKSLAYQVNAPFLLLKHEKAQLLAARSSTYYWYSKTRVEDELRLAEQTLELGKKGVPIYKGMTGLQERAYLSPADNSAQPYWVYVPKAYTPDKAWPVVVFLHGYDPAVDKVNAWLPSEDVAQCFEDRGYIFAVPYGRRNTDFVGIGEVDTLTVVDECQRHFNIDPDRVYLAGVSMGGYGVYAVAMHHPHRFAAIALASGRTDHYFWQDLNRDDVAPFKRFLTDADNPWDLIDNLRNVPTHLQQGQHDSLVNPEHSRRIIKEFERRGFDAQFDEIPGEDHWIYFETECYTRMLDWFDKHPKRTVPREVTFTTFVPKYRQAHWVTIDELGKWGTPARVRAVVNDVGAVDVSTQNVCRLTVAVPKELLRQGKPLVVRVNGSEAYSGPFAPGDRLTVRVGEPAADETHGGAPAKSWKQSGPMKEAYNGPFLVVHGTKGDKQANAVSLSQAQRAVSEWYRFADGIPPSKADTDVTEADMQARNLILFGDERTNDVVARIRGRLPFPLKDGTVTIGERTYDYDADGGGFMLCYPNPLAPQRLVVVSAGLFWGDRLPINHKFDVLPDFIVYTRQEMFDQTNRFECAGFFDKHWRFDPKLVSPPPGKSPKTLTKPPARPTFDFAKMGTDAGPVTASLVKQQP